mgnify:FL=1
MVEYKKITLEEILKSLKDPKCSLKYVEIEGIARGAVKYPHLGDVSKSHNRYDLAFFLQDGSNFTDINFEPSDLNYEECHAALKTSSESGFKIIIKGYLQSTPEDVHKGIGILADKITFGNFVYKRYSYK